MARTHKIGIDYFSHDVDMCQDNKMRLLIARFGLDGYGVFNRLLEELYREKGYYLEITEDFNILFSNDNNIAIDVYINILNDCIKRDLFDINLYEKYNILTSKRIQKNYIAATSRKIKAEFKKEYLLFTEEEIIELYPEKVNVCINSLNDNIKGENDNIGTQRKGNRKEKKVDNIKEDIFEQTDEQKNIELFNYWQSKEQLHTHGYLTKEIKKQLDKLTKKDVEDVKLAIDRYLSAFIDRDYYYNNSWILNKFIQQGNGYKAWLDEGERWIDYNSRVIENEKKAQQDTYESIPEGW